MPEDIKRLVKDVQHDPLTIQIGLSAPASSVSHALYPVQPHLKTPLLKEILRATKTESVIVFTRTKHRCERLAEQLMRSGYKVATLQGDMTQSARQDAIEGFRAGTLKILVATDIAARGLDILTISHVINYDMPDTTDAYTHRIGRTGRVDNTGEAYTLVTSEDREMIRALEKIFKKPIESRKVEGFNYDSEAPVRSDSMPPRHAYSRPAQPRSGEAPANAGRPNRSTSPRNRFPRRDQTSRERINSR
jgi:ATP-dependent RNA helicase RhlE